MQITDIKNAVFANAEQTAINCKIQLSSSEWLPFTASSNDTEQHGRDVFAAIIESGNVADYVEPEPQPESVPQSLTARQARLALHGIGKLSGVPAAIAALPEPQKTQAEIEWEYATHIERNNQFVAVLASALQLTDEQINQLFIEGAKL